MVAEHAFDGALGRTGGSSERRRLHPKDLAARHRAAGHPDDEVDVGAPRGGDRGDDGALGMADQADARSIDAGASTQQVNRGQGIAGEVFNRRTGDRAGRSADTAIVASQHGNAALLRTTRRST